jgi:receptor protein-tyrosine kinase
MKIESCDSVSPTANSHGPQPLLLGQSKSLGSILLAQGKLNPITLAEVIRVQEREGCRLGEAALRLSLISEEDLHEALCRQYDLPTAMPIGLADELIAMHEPYHPSTEELRVLRTRLELGWRQSGEKRRILAVLSPGRGEGRSYLAANLAVLFAQLGERTLLIDADFRQPRQHRIFGISDRFGLSTVLAGRAEAGAAVKVPGISKLVVLPAGMPPPNPLEQLSRPSLNGLFEACLRDFSVVLIDTASAMAFPDALSVGVHAGNALVVARQGHTRLADTQQLITDLKKSQVRVVGTVMNAC